MNLGRTAGLLSTAILVALSACSETEKELPPSEGKTVQSIPKGSIPDPCGAAEEYRGQLEELRSKYAENHPDVIRLRHLIEAADADCATGVPEDWEPFTFNGRKYYKQPLNDSDHE
jgi:hypothetical protein